MSDDVVSALAWSLVHSLWQGAAVTLAAVFVAAFLGRARSTTRYAVWCGALVAMLLLPVGTFFLLRASPGAASSSVVVIAPAASSSLAVAAATPVPLVRPWTPWLVAAWMVGVALFGLRSVAGWILVQRLRSRMTFPVAGAIDVAARRLGAKLGIRRSVRVLASSATQVPATFGWLRPVVLLPVSAFTALTPEQLELLIAHELAHVRRHDYLVNLAQTGMEIVMFYHPAVWWVSGRIRAEREHCCDELVVASCGDVARYVGALAALAALEGLRSHRPTLALAADGGSLLSRIKRLRISDRRPGAALPAWLGALLPLAALVALVVSGVPRQATAASAPERREGVPGFLGGLTDAGYTDLSVDEIIALKDHGLDPRYIKNLLAAGLGTPDVNQLIRLHDHGVEPDFAAAMAKSGLVSDLGFETVIRLHENSADGDDMASIRGLGFGPFASADVITLRQHGVEASTFAALKEAGRTSATVADALLFQENGVTVSRIRQMKSQGFGNLTLEQIVKLCRAGII